METEDYFLLITAIITGFIGMHGKDLDLWLGIILKLISIFSFFVLIIINLPKFIKTIKEIFKK